MTDTPNHSIEHTPDIQEHLIGLPDPDGLAKTIRQHFVGYTTYEPPYREASRASKHYADLGDLAKALRKAQIKVTRMPLPLEAQLILDAKRRDAGDVVRAAFDAMVDPLLDQIQELMSDLKPHFARRGNQGPSQHLDTLIAYVSTTLQSAGAYDFNQRARNILDAYQVGYPSDDGAFRDAVERGRIHLDGPASEGSLEWCLDRLKNRRGF